MWRSASPTFSHLHRYQPRLKSWGNFIGKLSEAENPGSQRVKTQNWPSVLFSYFVRRKVQTCTLIAAETYMHWDRSNRTNSRGEAKRDRKISEFDDARSRDACGVLDLGWDKQGSEQLVLGKFLKEKADWEDWRNCVENWVALGFSTDSSRKRQGKRIGVCG